MNLFVTKRNGHKEPIDLDKIHRVLTGCREADNVSVSPRWSPSPTSSSMTVSVPPTSTRPSSRRRLTFISEQSPDYNSTWLPVWPYLPPCRQEAPTASSSRPTLYQHVARLVDMGKYDKYLLEDYTQAEFEELNCAWITGAIWISPYAAVKQLEGKCTWYRTASPARFTRARSSSISW